MKTMSSPAELGSLYWTVSEAIAFGVLGDPIPLLGKPWLPDQGESPEEIYVSLRETPDYDRQRALSGKLGNFSPALAAYKEMEDKAAQSPEYAAEIQRIALARQDLKRRRAAVEQRLALAIQRGEVAADGRPIERLRKPPDEPVDSVRIPAQDLIGRVLLSGPTLPPGESWLATVNNRTGCPVHHYVDVLLNSDEIKRLFSVQPNHAVMSVDSGLVEDTVEQPSASNRLDCSVKQSSRQRGPRAGTVGYGAKDAALFSELKSIMDNEGLSCNAAALRLAKEGRVPGKGILESRATRLARQYASYQKKLDQTKPRLFGEP